MRGRPRGETDLGQSPVSRSHGELRQVFLVRELRGSAHVYSLLTWTFSTTVFLREILCQNVTKVRITLKET